MGKNQKELTVEILNPEAIKKAQEIFTKEVFAIFEQVQAKNIEAKEE